MTYASYELDLRDGPIQRDAWRRDAARARRLAREKPDEAERWNVERRKFIRYAWDSRRRWLRAKAERERIAKVA